MIPVHEAEDFALAVHQKLLLEVSGRTPVSHLRPTAATIPYGPGGALGGRQGGASDQDRNCLSRDDGCAAGIPGAHRPEVSRCSGSTSDIIRSIENGQINLGFIRPIENIGSLRFFSIAHERYLLAVEKTSPLALRSEIDIAISRRCSRHLV